MRFVPPGFAEVLIVKLAALGERPKFHPRSGELITIDAAGSTCRLSFAFKSGEGINKQLHLRVQAVGRGACDDAFAEEVALCRCLLELSEAVRAVADRFPGLAVAGLNSDDSISPPGMLRPWRAAAAALDAQTHITTLL